MKRETGIRNIGFSDCEELANWSNEQCGETVLCEFTVLRQ